ncbi:MAG: V-type ATPase subunit, partial [Thermodesulfobacteriota bacterium]
GGKIREREFVCLFETKSVREFLERIPSVLHGREWEESVRTVDVTNPLHLETGLNRGLRRFICRCALERPLSIAVPVCFLYTKYSEVERLRLIATGINFKIPQGELRGIVAAYQ